MRLVGRIEDWNDDRGYGFVRPNGGGERAFVHIKAFARAGKRPVSGSLISYVVQRDNQGRDNATQIAYVVASRTRGGGAPASTAVVRTGLRRGLAVAAPLLLLAGALLSWLPPIVVLAYAAMSLLAFVCYGVDKSAARAGRRRTPESTLQMIALLGGWPGALLAQDIFRHKSSKASFQSLFWIIVLLNCAGLSWLLASGQAQAFSRAMLGA